MNVPPQDQRTGRCSMQGVHFEPDLTGRIYISQRLGTAPAAPRYPSQRSISMEEVNRTTAEARRSTLGTLSVIAVILLIVGGINWGLVGLLNFDLVAAIFGRMSAISRLVYILVGVSAIIALLGFNRLTRTA
jgi:uncharacterized protein